jgi:hypothetical protein
MKAHPISVAVQISNQTSHPAVNGRSGALEVILFVIGLIFIVHSAVGIATGPAASRDSTYKWLFVGLVIVMLAVTI